MGPQVTAKNDSLVAANTLPACVADVALIDGPTCAAIGSVSLSWWHDAVRAGRAPQPAVRAPRCTRWRAIDVRAFWQRFAEQGDAAAAERLMATAKKASAGARAKRAARAEAAQ